MLQAWGMSAEAAAKFAAMSEQPVWPANWPAVEVMVAMDTQWRHGFDGPKGFDYAVLPAVMDLLGVDCRRRREVFEQLRILEVEALTCIRERRGG